MSRAQHLRRKGGSIIEDDSISSARPVDGRWLTEVTLVVGMTLLGMWFVLIVYWWGLPR